MIIKNSIIITLTVWYLISLSTPYVINNDESHVASALFPSRFFNKATRSLKISDTYGFEEIKVRKLIQ